MADRSTLSRERGRPLAGGSLALLLAASLCGLLSGCSGDDASALSDGADGKTAFGWGLFDTRPGEPYSFGSINLCVLGPGPVTVTSVAGVDVEGNASVDAFATRDNPGQTGKGALYADGEGSLADLSRGLGSTASSAIGLDPAGGKTVRGRCGTADTNTELAVQLSKPHDSTARITGLAVSYVAGAEPSSGSTRRFVVPVTLTLCSPSDHTSPGCH